MKTSNSDRYKKSFDNLHLSGDFSSRLSESLEKEREDKKVVNLFSAGKIAAAIAICSLTCGTACYACDVGGIRTNFNIWLNGSNQEIEVQDNGDGSYTYYDDNGHEYGFGGVSLGPNGEETPMTPDEYFELLNNEGVLRINDEGRTLFYYHNLVEDVTDFIEDGELYLHVEDPSNPYTYFAFTEISGNGNYACSTGDSKEWFKDYIEIDASDLITGDQALELGEDETVSYAVTTDEDN